MKRCAIGRDRHDAAPAVLYRTTCVGGRPLPRVRLAVCVALPCLLSLPRSAAPQDRPRSVQERDRGDSPEDRTKDFLALAARLDRQFDYKERSFALETATGESVIVLWGNVRGPFTWNGEEVWVRADRILGLIDTDLEKRPPDSEADASETDSPQVDPPAADPAPPNGPPGEDASKSPKIQIESASFYAEGNVRLEGRDITVEADAFFFDRDRQRGVAVKASARGGVDEIQRLQQRFGSPRGSNLTFLSEFRADLRSGPSIGPSQTELDERTGPRTPAQGLPREAGAVPRAEPLGSSWRRTGSQMALRADVLRMVDVEHFHGEGLTISTCEYGLPHFGLHFHTVRVTEDDSGPPPESVPGPADAPKDGVAPPPSAGEGDEEPRPEAPPAAAAPRPSPEDAPTHGVDPEGGTIQFHGLSLTPLPIPYWNTRWRLDRIQNPIRTVGYSNSGQYGNRVDVTWNLNWFLQFLPGTATPAVDSFLDRSRLDVNMDYMSERGLGYGPEGIYGKDPRLWDPWELAPESASYRGQGIYYRLDDRGEDRTAPVGTPPVDEDRYWGAIVHRQRLPYVGVLDIEYSQQSDRNFLREFFPETRTEKEQESLFYLRRSVRDNMAGTVLAKYRTNDFETTTERLPEGKAFLLEQPVFDTGVYTSLQAQAANLRVRPSDDFNLRSERYGRFDLLNDWSYPFHLGRYLYVRPFFTGRYTAYEMGRDPSDNSIDRESLAAGVSASQEWSRVFRTRNSVLDDWFGIDALKHSLIPKVTYANVFENTEDPSRFIPVDRVDEVDRGEAIELSLHNILWARSVDNRAERRAALEKLEEEPWRGGRDWRQLRTIPTQTRAVVDAEVSARWYPRPARDNDGDRFSFLDVDVAFSPFVRTPQRDYLTNLTLRSRNFLDLNDDLNYDLLDNSLAIEVVPQYLNVVVGQRVRRSVSDYFYGDVSVRLGPKYYLEVFAGYDRDDSNRTDVEVRLVRFLHRFALEVGYGFDGGKRDDHTVSFNFYPVELFSSVWERPAFDSAPGIGEDGAR